MKNNISEQEIEVGLWRLKHQKAIKKISTMVALVIVAAIVINFVYLLVDYFIKIPQGDKFVEELTKENVKFLEHHEKVAPIALEVELEGATENRRGEFDLYAKVKNHNQNWAATGCNYSFLVGDTATDVKNAFFLPEEEKYLLDFAFNSPTTTSADSLKVDLVLENCQWQRINDPASLVEADFQVNDLEIKQGTLVEGSGFNRSSENSNLNVDIYGFPTTNTNAKTVKGSSLTQVVMDLTNKSVYGFWRVGITVVLSYQGKIVGVNYLSLDRFLSFERRNIIFNWPKYFSRNANVETVIEANTLDEGNLIGLGE